MISKKKVINALNPQQAFKWILSVLRCFLFNYITPYKTGLIRLKGSLCFLQQHPSKATTAEGVQLLEIPYSKGLPVVGTLFDLLRSGGATQLHKYIDKRHRQYGPIFRETLGGTQDAIFVASANLMRSVFLHEGQRPQHPLPDAWTLYNKEHKCQRGLFFMEGGEWFHNRRMLNRLLLNGNLDWMNLHIQAATNHFVLELKCRAAESSEYYEIKNLEQKLYRWSINVVCSIMFGYSATIQPQADKTIATFTQIVHKIFSSTSVLMNFPPALAKLLRLQIWREFEQNVMEVLKYGDIIIELFLELAAAEEGQLALPEEQDKQTLFHKLQSAGMPLKMIKRIFVDLVIAAGDTTAFTSQWALYLITQNKELQRNLSKECLDNKHASALVRGLIKETLRLYPVAPFIGRYLANDAEIGGYHLKKDTLVLLSLYTAGRDESHFPDPLTIKPERWLRNPDTAQLNGVLQAHGSLPFAIGNRSCIGRRVANNQLHSLIAEFCSNFEIKCLNENPIECVLRMITVPDATLRIAVKLREEF